MEDGIRKALFELADREAGNMKDAETEKLLLDMQDQGQVIQNEFFNVGTDKPAVLPDGGEYRGRRGPPDGNIAGIYDPGRIGDQEDGRKGEKAEGSAEEDRDQE